ncbi:MAG: GTPase Era [Flavobacteriales bacterium]|nr:GTPase Era [Flavobacteriales bacterium]|tara:strand:- start:488 stop:1369 length:882 start_codon:yes stop_codon:yes gene_type:complete
MKHKSGFVNIIGNPNVGKSTLMNKLIGQDLSIITNKAQTTRHRIKGILSEKDFQIVFSDTPGIIKPAYKLQENMMDYVKSALKDADVILYVVEIGEKELKDEELYKQIKQLKIPLIILLNKIDLVSQENVLSEIESWKSIFSNATILPISALNGFNIKETVKIIVNVLPFSPPYFSKDDVTDKSERFFVEEIIREKILKHYKKEVPYSVQISVEEFFEEKEIVKIRAIIYVLRESQKGILIGHKGLGLKRIGSEARKDIEKLLDKKVFLATPIKVKKDWRNDNKQLKKFGYGS